MQPLLVSIPAKAASSYPIITGFNLLQSPYEWLPPSVLSHKCIIITDETVALLYGEVLVQALNAQNPLLITMQAGESFKNAATKQSIEAIMQNHLCGRDTFILALGGGVVGDMAGFIAATYARGIPYIHLPTTVMAMVDSSIGGKTGINADCGKNLIGAFWQPLAVVADFSCLASLPISQLFNGLIEALKIFLTCDAGFFAYFCQEIPALQARALPVLTKIIQRAMQLKAEIVSQDPEENNQRMVLNAGHTIGHALEHVSKFKLLHGQAVGFGLLIEAQMSLRLGLLDSEAYEKIQTALQGLDIHVNNLSNFKIEALLSAMRLDKKNRSNQMNFVLLKSIGAVHISSMGSYVHAVEESLVKDVLSTFM